MLQKTIQPIKQAVIDYFTDLRRLFHSSPLATLFVIISQLLLGSLPVVLLWIFGQFTDAMIGARAISVWTSAITDLAWLQVGWMVLFLLLVPLTARFTKLAASLARRTRLIIFIASTFIIAIPVAATQLFLIFLLAIPAFHAKYILPHAGLAVLMWTLAVHALFNLTYLTVHQYVTTGTMLTWAGSILMLTLWFSIKPFMNTKALCE